MFSFFSLCDCYPNFTTKELKEELRKSKEELRKSKEELHKVLESKEQEIRIKNQYISDLEFKVKLLS